MSSTALSLAQARRTAVRAQLLDGSATDVLPTVRALGFLQLDSISVVAPPVLELRSSAKFLGAARIEA